MADDIIDLLQIKIENAKRNLSEETQNAINAVDWRATILGLRNKYGYTFEQLGDLELETELLLCGLVGAENYPKELSKRMQITKMAANELVNEMNNLVFKKIREEMVKNAERKKIFVKSSPLEEYPLGGGGRMYPPRLSATPQEGNNDTQVLNSAGIKIIPARNAYGIAYAGGSDQTKVPITRLVQMGKLELTAGEDKMEKLEDIPLILAQKLSGSVQMPAVETEHFLNNITQTSPRIGIPVENIKVKTVNEAKIPIPEPPKTYPKNMDPYRLSPDE